MSDLVVRRLLIDLDTPPVRHWCGGDAFRTAWFNALSMSFPSGEQFFIDAVRAGVQSLPEEQRARFEPAVRGFIGQEATHRRIHALFNAHLTTQGLVNRWEARALRRIRSLEGADLRVAVGATAATEHLTAILAEHLLGEPASLQGRAAPGHAVVVARQRRDRTPCHRVRSVPANGWQRRVAPAAVPLGDLALRHRLVAPDREQPVATAASGAPAPGRGLALVGPQGPARTLAGPWRRYRSVDFHPSQQDESRAVSGLRANAAQFEPVARSAPATTAEASA
jgi:predicted metal-dependent hydrolase